MAEYQSFNNTNPYAPGYNPKAVAPMPGTQEWADAEARKRADELARKEHEQALKMAGSPKRPEWESLLGQDGLMKDQYQINDVLNTGFLDQMRQDNLRGAGTPSAWRNLMEQNVQRQAGDASANMQAQGANAMSNLAMMGGLRSGSAERMASKFGNQAALAQQNVLGQRLNLDVQDEQMRQQGLQNLGQMELGTAQYQTGVQQANVGNALNETLQKRADNINAYNEQMRAWASERTAAATPSSGGGKK